MNNHFNSPSDLPEKPRKSKAALIVSIACGTLAALAAVALVIGAGLGLFDQKSPFEKTMQAVFPELSTLETMMARGGSISYYEEAHSDLYERLGDHTFIRTVACQYDRHRVMLRTSVGSEQNAIDSAVLIDQNDIRFFSSRLLEEQSYSIAWEGLMDAIDASPFAPDSGTPYAMSEETYRSLKHILQSTEERAENTATLAALKSVYEAMMEKVTIEREKKEISLLDGRSEATVFRITFDVSALIAALEEVKAQWEENEALRAELDAYLEGSAELQPNPGTWLKEQKAELDRVMGEELDTLLAACKEEAGMEGRIEYAVVGGYFVSLEASLSAWEKTETAARLDETVLDFSWRFNKNPSSAGDFDLSFKVTEDGSEEMSLSLVCRDTEEKQTMEAHFFTVSRSEEGNVAMRGTMTLIGNADGTFTVQTGQSAAVFEAELKDSDYQPVFSLALGGTWYRAPGKTEITLDSAKMLDGEENEMLTVDQSVIRLTLVSGKGEIALPATNDTRLLEMSETELDAADEKINLALAAAAESLNTALGIELMHNAAGYAAVSRLVLDPSTTAYAIDSKTGRVFVCTHDNKVLTAYDMNTMEEVGKLEITRTILSFDADNGRLAIMVLGRKGFVDVYDAETLKKQKSLKFEKSYDGVSSETSELYDLAVDGDKLFVTENGFGCFLADLATEEMQPLSLSLYKAVAVVDRETHRMGILDTGNTGCNFSVCDSQTMELLMDYKVRISFANEALYYNGTCFQTKNRYFSPDGYLTTASELTEERSKKDREKTLIGLVRKDAGGIITLEADENGNLYTMCYTPQGTLYDKASVAITSMEWVDEDTRLAVVYDGSANYLVNYSVSRDWRLVLGD